LTSYPDSFSENVLLWEAKRAFYYESFEHNGGSLGLDI